MQGKDPYDLTEAKFWLRAVAQGGGAGYLGDLLFKDPTEQRSSSAEQAIGTVLGPSAGAVAGLAGDLVVANAWEAAKGKDNSYLGLLRQASHSHVDQAQVARLLRRRGHAVAGDLSKIYRKKPA